MAITNPVISNAWAAKPQSVQRLARCWTTQGSNPVGTTFSVHVQTGSGVHPGFCTSSQGVAFTTQTYLVPSGPSWPVTRLNLPLFAYLISNVAKKIYIYIRVVIISELNNQYILYLLDITALQCKTRERGAIDRPFLEGKRRLFYTSRYNKIHHTSYNFVI